VAARRVRRVRRVQDAAGGNDVMNRMCSNILANTGWAQGHPVYRNDDRRPLKKL
jgi:hypothetical protein